MKARTRANDNLWSYNQHIGFSGSKEFFSGEYVDPAIASYYAYECCYCQKYFYLVQSRDFQAGGCKRTVQYRNKETGEIKAAENRSEGICMTCTKEIMRRQEW